MSTDLVVFDDKKVDLIKNIFAKNATNEEFELFLCMCQRLKLDPTIKQIYFTKFPQKNGQEGKMTIMVSIDGYRLIADRTGKYMPGKEPTFTYDKDGRLFSATSYVKKLGIDGLWHEFGATAMLSEYDTGRNQWISGKHYMLAKCAESLALRKGFPAEFSGTHTVDEMGKVIVEAEVEEDKKAPKQIAEESVKRFMSIDQIQELDDLLDGDVKYKESLINSYKAKGWNINSFFDLPAGQFAGLKVRIQANNKNRNFSETEAVNA